MTNSSRIVHHCRQFQFNTLIGKEAFKNCSNLSSLSLPDSVQTIKTNAFYNCSSMSSINVPSSLESIEFNTFVNNSSTIFESLHGKCKVSDDYIKHSMFFS